MHYFPEALPEFRLTASGNVTSGFLALELSSFREAAGYIQRLPYGRTTDRAAYGLVLEEGRGTCSTKHALLAALAEEHECTDVSLTLGIYEMTGRNTPGVGSTLREYGLCSIPEAHCYLTHAGRRVDLTVSGASAAESIDRFLHEQTIFPEEIGQHKMSLHERFLVQWAKKAGSPYGWRELLNIREECIAALSGAS